MVHLKHIEIQWILLPHFHHHQVKGKKKNKSQAPQQLIHCRPWTEGWEPVLPKANQEQLQIIPAKNFPQEIRWN